MHRAFVTAQMLFRPEFVFILGESLTPHLLILGEKESGWRGAGDLFDEGQWSGEAEFAGYAARLHSLFPTEGRLFAVEGNHDVGFHYAIAPPVLKRFQVPSPVDVLPF